RKWREQNSNDENCGGGPHLAAGNRGVSAQPRRPPDNRRSGHGHAQHDRRIAPERRQRDGVRACAIAAAVVEREVRARCPEQAEFEQSEVGHGVHQRALDAKPFRAEPAEDERRDDEAEPGRQHGEGHTGTERPEASRTAAWRRHGACSETARRAAIDLVRTVTRLQTSSIAAAVCFHEKRAETAGLSARRCAGTPMPRSNAAAAASTSRGSTNIAASPSTSRAAPQPLTTTGVPRTAASRAGSPKLSRHDRLINAAASS